MDDNGEPSNVPNTNRFQETYQRAQKTQTDQQFPINSSSCSSGVVAVPRGSRGPRSLYIKRHDDSFGFTLRHFIVYPPDSLAENCDGRHAAVGALLAPMDTIFVKHVRDRSPAKQAGLQRGDRLVGVNGVPVKNKSYSEVVQLIVNSPEYLHLLVVPKEEDVLQRFFAETAYNPASNRPTYYSDIPNDRQTAQRFLTHHLLGGGGGRDAAPGFKVDAISWRSLQQPYYAAQSDDIWQQNNERKTTRSSNLRSGQQRSADNIYSETTSRPQPQRSSRQQQLLQQEIYSEIYPNECGTQKIKSSRAVPQVPLYRKMGRRASEGNTLSERERYKPQDYPSLNLSSSGNNLEDDHNMKASAYCNTYNNKINYENGSLNNPSDVLVTEGRRESTSSSLCSSSKESLASSSSLFGGSTSTLTGHETDDSAIMTRVRRSVQQKEEFLLSLPPTALSEELQPGQVRRDFYIRPKRLEKPIWPPQMEGRATTTMKPAHQNVVRVKNDIDNEREMTMVQPFVDPHQQKGATSPMEKLMVIHHQHHSDDVPEGEMAPKGYDSLEESRYPVAALQIVQKRAKDFESGRPLPEDDAASGNKMNFSRSELSRLSSKKLVPTVCARAQEYETRTTSASTTGVPSAYEPRRDASSTSTSTSATTSSSAVTASMMATPNTSQKRIQRDSRSLDSSGSYASCSSITSIYNDATATTTTGTSSNKKLLSGNVTIPSGSKYLHCPPPPDYQEQQNGDITTTTDISSNQTSKVLHIRSNSAESWLEGGETLDDRSSSKETTSKRISRQDTANLASHSLRQKPNVSVDDKPVVVKRRPKNTNISEDERAMRRESYLKATEGGRMQLDTSNNQHYHLLNDVDDDVSPQMLRSGSISSTSSGSLDKDGKICGSPTLEEKQQRYSIIREGNLHCKILEIDGKRSTDRSWKQVFIVLKGPKLYLYKDRHYLSPVSSSDAVDQYLSSGVDMRTSVVRVAEDYTKRKNVLRVSAVKPCRSEFLLQTESTDELADWVKVFQEQVAASTDAELEPKNSKQQAVPQLVPAQTTIQVQGSHLSPQWNTSTNKPKNTSSRNRSPTGQSPVSKSRKPSQIIEPACTSPKTKTWKGRMVKQLKRFNHSANNPNSPSAPPPEGSTFGIALEDCLPSPTNIYLPKFVEFCTDIIDEKGLHTIGIYRVPGNNASITGLTEEINKTYDDLPMEDPRWNDLHVVSSLLKSYFRKMPDSLVTNHLYPSFIKADEIKDARLRMEELKRLVHCLPKHNYHTLKHIIGHLKRVADNSDMNKMQAKNLAIVFGPTIVRSEAENMENMVNHMTNQCKIVESLLTHADWFFSENFSGDDSYTSNIIPAPVSTDVIEDFDSPHNQALLLHNISKYEAFKDTKEKNGALLSSIISAAQRKVKRKPNNHNNKSGGNHNVTMQDPKDDGTTNNSPTNLKIFPSQSFSPSDLKETCVVDGKNEGMPTNITEMQQQIKSSGASAVGSEKKVPWFNYSKDTEEFLRRIENFKQETEAMLQLPRKTEISVNNIDTRTLGQQFSSSSACNVNQQEQQQQRLSTTLSTAAEVTSGAGEHQHHQMLTKTHSACNVFDQQLHHNRQHARKSLHAHDVDSSSCCGRDRYSSLPYDSSGICDAKTRLYNNKNNSDCNSGVSSDRYSNTTTTSSSDHRDGSKVNNGGRVVAVVGMNKSGGSTERRYLLRRGNSAEDVNNDGGNSSSIGSSDCMLNNGNMKKVKFENEGECHRTESLDSLNKLANDDESLLSTMTKLIDKKLKEELSSSSVVMSPLRSAVPQIPKNEDQKCYSKKSQNITSIVDKENILIHEQASDLYRNPSLHKNTNNILYNYYNKKEDQESNKKEKEDDTTTTAPTEVCNQPDNERHLLSSNKPLLLQNTNNKTNGSKLLRRSESLNKPERSSNTSPMNKLKRSESLNKSNNNQNNEHYRLKRSDSLSKTEKTENNLNKRRESAAAVAAASTSSNKRMITDKDTSAATTTGTKNKRKNGMPDRSIKRRHTVGGTKDPDKITWLFDNNNKRNNNTSGCGDEQNLGAQNQMMTSDTCSDNNRKEKSLRTSSPDLSSSRRGDCTNKFLFEINLIGPAENMVVALRQHLIGGGGGPGGTGRPQSFSDASPYKVPLESHV